MQTHAAPPPLHLLRSEFKLVQPDLVTALGGRHLKGRVEGLGFVTQLSLMQGKMQGRGSQGGIDEHGITTTSSQC